MNNALRTDFRRKCNEHITDPRELAYMEALFEESPEISHIPIESLWKALNFPLRWVQVHALYELFRRRDQAPLTPLSPKTRILMLGQHAWTQEDLGPVLEQIGHTLTDLHAFNPGTDSPVIQFSKNDVILLGPAPGEWINYIPRDLPIFKEEEITTIAIESGEFYLLDGDKHIEQGNLKTMLLSTDNSSIELALQLMANGGMPTDFTTILFSMKRSRLPFRLRQEASNYLMRFTSGVFKYNLLRNYFDLLGGDKQLLAADLNKYDPDGLIDLDQYLRLNFQLTRGGENNGENLVGYHNGLSGLSDDFSRGILDCLESERRLRFPKTTTVFPKVTYQMDHLKSIEIYNAPLESLPDGISQMPSLIRIWFNCALRSLPSDIGKSPSIKMVNLFNGEFPAFPEDLAHLKRLKIFRWENCLADPDQPLELPESLFERRLDTVIIIEKHIHFPKSFFQSPTLRSLALSFQSALDQLDQIGMISSLQRIRIQFDPKERPSLKQALEKLPDWRLEDQNERNFSFVRK